MRELRTFAATGVNSADTVAGSVVENRWGNLRGCTYAAESRVNMSASTKESAGAPVHASIRNRISLMLGIPSFLQNPHDMKFRTL
jgi:hypothetical protein